MDETMDFSQAPEDSAEPEQEFLDDTENSDLEDLPLFGDEESSEEGEEPEEPEEEFPEEGQEPTFEINGQQMSLEDVNRSFGYAQRAAREVLQLRQDTALLDDYARLAGMSRQEYLSALAQNLQEAKIQREAQMKGVEPDAIRQQMQIRQQQEQALLQQQRQLQAQEQARTARLAPYRELISRYPQLQNPANLPPQVAAQIQQGVHPVVAYQDFILSQQQIEAQKQIIREKSPGSAAGTGNGDLDGALAAFMSVFNE